MPKLGIAAKLENLMPNCKNNAKKCQPAKQKFLQPSFFKMPNVKHFEMPADAWIAPVEKMYVCEYL